MRTYVSLSGRLGVAPGVGGVLAAVLLAPFVLGAIIASGLLAVLAAALGAVTGHHLRPSSRTLSATAWSVAALIPLGLLLAFFGHASDAAVKAGVYIALGAVPASIVLLMASVYAEG